MNLDAIVTAMTAQADQKIAADKVEVAKLVEAYRELRADGDDLPVATGMVIMASLATLSPRRACQLLGVAVAMLAEQPAGGGEVP